MLNVVVQSGALAERDRARQALNRRISRCRLTKGVGFLVLAVIAWSPSGAQDEDGWSFDWEIKGHYRDSEAVSFPSPVPLPFPATIDTVDPGEHAELSLISVQARYQSDWFGFRAKVDAIDLHERNPTSEDREIDIDELWVLFGRGTESGVLPQTDWGAYAKVGKFPKFERQNDRHLESYGVVSTAFNRLEDAGLEIGLDIGKNFYVRGSFTQGNPVFLRDPNALAGDNGTDIRLDAPPQVKFGSGVVILYDAEVEYDLDFNEPEVGLGLGVRFGDPAGYWVFDALAFAYQRDLQDTVVLEGTLYGGDLDVLLGPFNALSLGVTGREKEEAGVNVWFYRGGLSLFAQYVDQDLAGLRRQGSELEVAWRFELPGSWTVGGHRLFAAVAPSLRYSKLDTENFGGSPFYPAVSVRWPWQKWDYGFRLDVWKRVDLTVERADNTFVRAGRDETMAETLLTLRWRR